MSHGHSGLGSTGDRTFNETPPPLGGISGSEVQMTFMTRKLVGEASEASGAVGAPAAVRERVITPVVTEPGQQADPRHEFFENGLPLRDRFLQSTGLETESVQHRMLFTAFVGEAADQR